eukprot:NODE_22_length_38364_cov_0.248661.p12 type:complete len:339 gc:universal NODE_22_length_38364_cov_0.248661:28225-27209(-)
MRFQIHKNVFMTAVIIEELIDIKIEINGREWSNRFSNGFIQKMSAKCGEWMDLDEFNGMIELTQLNREALYIIKEEDKYKLIGGKSLRSLDTQQVENEDKIFLVFVNNHKKVYYPLPLIRVDFDIRNAIKTEIPANMKDLQLEIRDISSLLITHITSGDLELGKKEAKRLQLLNLALFENYWKETEAKDAKLKKQKSDLHDRKKEIEELTVVISNKRLEKKAKRRGNSRSTSSIAMPRQNKAYMLRQRFLNREDSKSVKLRHGYSSDVYSKFSGKSSESSGRAVPWWDRLSRSRSHSRAPLSSNNDSQKDSSVQIDSKSPLAGKILKLQTYLSRLKAI